ncbi:MAG: thiol-disulfide oxidoreductase DCC family protein [Ectothiorhodospira sp.]
MNDATSNEPTPPPGGRPEVYYDGGCGLCRREIGHYRRLDREGRVEWLDIHADPGVLERIGVDWETAMRRMHARDASGRVVTGARAFVTVWDCLPGYRWLARGVRAVPGVLPLMDLGYRGFARWRGRRRGVCGV